MFTKESENIIIAGDFVPSEKVLNILSTSNENYIDEVKEMFAAARDVYVNLEAPSTNSETKSNKVGPNLKVTPSSLDLLKMLNVNNVTLANNHFCDFGDNGFKDSLKKLHDLSIDYIGVKVNGEVKTKMTYLNDKSVAVFNFCENEFCTVDKENGCNLIDPVDNYNEINSITNADFKVVILHGGTEYCNIPNPSLRKVAKFYIDIGVDLVVCHHAHIYSGVEEYKGKKIYYGTGNFIFNTANPDETWHDGYVVKVSEHGNELISEAIPYTQCKGTELIKILNDSERKIFDKKMDDINKIILSNEDYEAFWDDYAIRNRVNYMSAALNMSRVERGIFRRLGLRFKRFKEKEKLMRLYNVISTESHYNNLMRLLAKELNIYNGKMR